MTDNLKPTLRKTISDSVYMKDKDDNEFLLNPKILSRSESSSKRRPTKLNQSNDFKLVTVRRLTNFSITDINNKLIAQQKRIDEAALRSGFSVSFPAPIITSTNDLKQVYGVFIDEDLYGATEPIYLYKSSSLINQCYVIATGKGKDDWIVSGCHVIEKKVTVDGNYIQKWRIYHIDKTANTRTDYILDSSALDDGFEYNFDTSNLQYLGGGTWFTLIAKPGDRIPIYAPIKSTVRQEYIDIGAEYSGIGNPERCAIVAYSMTPTTSLTWNRGVIQVNNRVREFSQKTDLALFSDSGVISTTREHSYRLDLTSRVAKPGIEEVKKEEFSKGKATYVGSTNYRVNSPFQSPDYGTDAARLALSDYRMETNVIRPARKTGVTLPILSSSSDSKVMISVELGTAIGKISHPFQVQTSSGNRGYDYSDYYKNWFAYGKVLSVTPYGDTNRYSIAKPSGEKVRIGNMLDLGRITTEKNKVITSWDSLPNPQTGFFNIITGRLTFWIQYLNPPLMGHDAVYYYELNPINIGAGGAYYNRVFGFEADVAQAKYIPGGASGNDALSRQQTNQAIYSQYLGALGGGALQSINIGQVNIAASEGESVVVREPTPDMKAELVVTPHLFPSGFWEADLLDVSIDTFNKGTFINYDSEGAVRKVWTLN